MNIQVNVPKITDATFDLTLSENKDKIPVSIPQEPIVVESETLPDGSVISGDNLTKIPPPVTTTLGEIKQKIADFQRIIAENNKENEDLQKQIDILIPQLAEVQSAVNVSLVDWKPTPVEQPENLPAEEEITPLP